MVRCTSSVRRSRLFTTPLGLSLLAEARRRDKVAPCLGLQKIRLDAVKRAFLCYLLVESALLGLSCQLRALICGDIAC